MGNSFDARFAGPVLHVDLGGPPLCPTQHFLSIPTTQAVKGIHELRIVHSDLKPANFLLVQGQLKLIDFVSAHLLKRFIACFLTSAFVMSCLCLDLFFVPLSYIHCASATALSH